MRALVFEMFPFHFEIIPGFVSIFLQMGYQVDCLLQEVKSYGDVFCRCEEMRKKIGIYYYTSDSLSDMLQDLQLRNHYDLVFFSSVEIGYGTCRQALLQIENHFDTKPKLAGCCHSFQFPEEEIREALLRFDGRIVTLSASETPYGNFPEVNPNYFCDIEKEGQKHKKPTVISIGISTNPYELTKAANMIYKKTGNTVHLTMVSNKDSRYEMINSRYEMIKHLIKYCLIRVFKLKKYDLERHGPRTIMNRNVRKEIEITGRITFSDMFSRIDSSDFIAVNLFEREVKVFSSIRTSGAKQLSLGFLKPCIIEKAVADYYGFNEKNAVVYNKGEFVQALERAVSMNETQYAEMVEALKELRDRIRESSLNNLRKIVSDP